MATNTGTVFVFREGRLVAAKLYPDLHSAQHFAEGIALANQIHDLGICCYVMPIGLKAMRANETADEICKAVTLIPDCVHGPAYQCYCCDRFACVACDALYAEEPLSIKTAVRQCTECKRAGHDPLGARGPSTGPRCSEDAASERLIPLRMASLEPMGGPAIVPFGANTRGRCPDCKHTIGIHSEKGCGYHFGDPGEESVAGGPCPCKRTRATVPPCCELDNDGDGNCPRHPPSRSPS